MATELSLTRAKKAVKLVTVNVRIWWENVGGGRGGEKFIFGENKAEKMN